MTPQCCAGQVLLIPPCIWATGCANEVVFNSTVTQDQIVPTLQATLGSSYPGGMPTQPYMYSSGQAVRTSLRICTQEGRAAADWHSAVHAAAEELTQLPRMV